MTDFLDTSAIQRAVEQSRRALDEQLQQFARRQRRQRVIRWGIRIAWAAIVAAGIVGSIWGR